MPTREGFASRRRLFLSNTYELRNRYVKQMIIMLVQELPIILDIDTNFGDTISPLSIIFHTLIINFIRNVTHSNSSVVAILKVEFDPMSTWK